MFFNNFLKKTRIEIELPICLYMDFMRPVEDTVLKIDIIQRVDALVQHLSCLEGFQ